MQIEKGVKLARDTRIIYPFKDMEVGDSFYFDGDAAKAKLVRSASAVFKARSGYHFSTLKDGDGYRTWRVR